MKNLLGKNVTYILLFAIFALGFSLSGGFSHKTSVPEQTNTKLIVVDKKPEGGKSMLQLDTLDFITQAPIPPPTSGPTQPIGTEPTSPLPTSPPDGTCAKDDAIPDYNCDCPENLIQCQGGECAGVISSPNGYTCDTPYYASGQNLPDGSTLLDSWCNDQTLVNGQDGQFCVGKPVIYLYPTKTMMVDVLLKIPGRIVESDPLYPPSGWKNVQAHPDGTLIYQGKNYRELYYESAIDKVNPPKNGLIIPIGQIRQTLTFATTKLGLNDFEQKEFLDYWLPKLQRLNSPYILFSILDPLEKDRIDHVEISPEPDTRIEFLAYFKPLTLSARSERSRTGLEGLIPLILPKNPPKRIGFTAVEWGGTIDPN